MQTVFAKISPPPPGYSYEDEIHLNLVGTRYIVSFSGSTLARLKQNTSQCNFNIIEILILNSVGGGIQG